MSHDFPLLERYTRKFDQPLEGDLTSFSLLASAYENGFISLESYLLGLEVQLKWGSLLTPKDSVLVQKMLLVLCHSEEGAQVAFEMSPSAVGDFEKWLSDCCSNANQASGSSLSSKSIQDLVSRVGDHGLIGPPDTNPVIVVDNGKLYFQKHFASKSIIERAIQSRRPAGPFCELPKNAVVAQIKELQENQGLALTKEQSLALLLSCQNNISWISGGPGTGKTFLIYFLTQLFTKLGCDPGRIKIAAPTGKSVERINTSLARLNQDSNNESPPIVAQTLHKLLGYTKNSPTPTYHQSQCLEADLVVVDESTMIDHASFADLLQACSPKTHLVFVGDKNQLPSIRPGGLFKEQFETKEDDSFVSLYKNFRMNPDNPSGAEILGFATDILENHCDLERFENDSPFEGRGGVTWIDPLKKPLEDVLAGQLERRSDLQRSSSTRIMKFDSTTFGEKDVAFLQELFVTLGQFKVLTPTNKGDLGTTALNRWYAEHHGQVTNALFYPGCPVMVNENNYELELWNGTEGMALWVQRPGSAPNLEFVFRTQQGFKSFDTNLNKLLVSPSHAITIHKSQGSEYSHVLALFPPQRSSLSQKSLVYTGCTRASNRLTVVSRLNDFLSYLA